VEVKVGGRADRIDMTGGAVRVVDYKTGAPKRDTITVEGLFDEEKDKRNDAVMQALFYCTLIRQSHPGRLVLPTIYWIQQLSSADFTPYTRAPGLEGPDALQEEWNTFMADFQRQLELTLNKIFADNEDFTMTSFRRRCAYCPYRTLCRR
jgi:hypothetical protein